MRWGWVLPATGARYREPILAYGVQLFHWYDDGVVAAFPWGTKIKISEGLLMYDKCHTLANGNIIIQCANGRAEYKQIDWHPGYIVGDLVMATYTPDDR